MPDITPIKEPGTKSPTQPQTPNTPEVKDPSGTTTLITPSPTTIFRDVLTTHHYAKAISYLKEKHVLTGYPDSTFKPTRPVNRAEFLKVLLEAKQVVLSTDTYKNCFSDVHSEWFAPYVCYAKEQGIIEGYPDAHLPASQWTFHPEQTMNKVEALKIILKAFSLDTETTMPSPFPDVVEQSWYAPYVARAYELNILEDTAGSQFTPGSFMKRGNIAELIYRILRMQEKQQTYYIP